MLTVRKQKSITAQNRCIQVSFSPIAKTSHNKICDVTLMKKGLGEGLTKGLKAFCQVALCLFKYALYVFHTKRLCAILSMFITYYVLWP